MKTKEEFGEVIKLKSLYTSDPFVEGEVYTAVCIDVIDEIFYFEYLHCKLRMRNIEEIFIKA